jgi:hypothetical protein
MRNKIEYERIAREWTTKYANGFQSDQKYTNDNNDYEEDVPELEDSDGDEMEMVD